MPTAAATFIAVGNESFDAARGHGGPFRGW
jgi:hypothetical protein